jgi:hypothetical protein
LNLVLRAADKSRQNVEELWQVLMQQSNRKYYTSEKDPLPGSDRSFGLVMAGAIAVLTVLNAWHSGWLWPWMLATATTFLVAASLRPSSLHPLNRLWTKIGVLLHKIVNPLAMVLLFYGAILPTGFLMRLRGKDLLRLKRDPKTETYWIARVPGPAAETMRDQF